MIVVLEPLGALRSVAQEKHSGTVLICFVSLSHISRAGGVESVGAGSHFLLTTVGAGVQHSVVQPRRASWPALIDEGQPNDLMSNCAPVQAPLRASHRPSKR